MEKLTKQLLACARYGALRCTVIAAVYEAASGVTVSELADTFSQSPYSTRYVIGRAVAAGWLRRTEEMRKRAFVYTRTTSGETMINNITT